MLDKIHNNGSEIIEQSQNLDRIKSIGATNPFEETDDDKFFIDQSEISQAAFEKYQRENDIKAFSDILFQTDQKEANDMVLKQAFEGTISIDDIDFLSELLNSEDFLNDIA